MKDLLNGWGPTAAVFLPLVGVAVMLAIPKSEETLHKAVSYTHLDVYKRQMLSTRIRYIPVTPGARVPRPTQA